MAYFSNDPILRPRLLEEVDDCFEYTDNIHDCLVNLDSGTKDTVDLLPSDPVDLLPSDPFGMVSEFNDKPIVNGGFDALCTGKEVESACRNDGDTTHSLAVCEVGNDRHDHYQGAGEFSEVCFNENLETHYAVLPLALDYLGVQDLLRVQMVSKSLCSTIQSDPSLWRSVHIDEPLNEKITNDVLLQLTSRAQGNLEFLSLMECPRITDDVLKHVLENNPKMSELCVPGCTRISIVGIIYSMKGLNDISSRAPGMKQLRISVNYHHFAEMQCLMNIDNNGKSWSRFYDASRDGELATVDIKLF